MKKQEMINLIQPMNSSPEMLKFFKVLVITIVQWPIELGAFLPGFIEWIKNDEEKKSFPPIVWLYGYMIDQGQRAKEAKGEADETGSK